MFHLRFGLSDHLKALRDFVFGSRRRVKKVRIFRAWFSHAFKTKIYYYFFLIAGCIGSLGYWQSLATRELNKQHQWYCVPKESQGAHSLCAAFHQVLDPYCSGSTSRHSAFQSSDGLTSFLLFGFPSLPFIFITSVLLVFRAGRHTHVFGLHLSMRLANGFVARHCI